MSIWRSLSGTEPVETIPSAVLYRRAFLSVCSGLSTPGALAFLSVCSGRPTFSALAGQS